MSTPNDAGTPAPAQRTAQVQGKAPGPRSAQQGSPEAVPVRQENLQEKDRQVTVAEPPGQSETETPARGQERCGRGGVGEIRLVKDDVLGDQNAARGQVKASVPLVVRGVPKEHTTSRAGR